MLRFAAFASTLFLSGLLLVPAPATSGQDQKTFPAEEVAHFEKTVYPILAKHCLKCHGAEAKVKGGFSLANRDKIIEGGETGSAVDFKKPRESILIKAIHREDGIEMPPSGKLADAEIEAITRWVKAGLPWSDKIKIEPKGEAHKEEGGKVTEEAKKFWAYQPIQVAPVPASNNAWVKNPIDAFVLAKLDAAGLQPNKPAERIALVRRVYYDLIGLPPTPAQVDSFLKDASPNAFEKLIDQLLASPQYGEKWGRHWLDVVRFGETNGYERDGPKPNAWRFRDYVIRSFNADKPYNQFIIEQLAGDELPGEDADAIIATGFYRLGLWDDEPADPLQSRFDEFDDIIATTSQAFLGMTMNCARCHDHKIDPIPQTDYYKMLAFVSDVPHFSDTRNTVSKFNSRDISAPEKRKLYEKELSERLAKIEALEKQMVAAEDVVIKRMPEEEQRASEGLDRPQVIKKLEKFQTAEEKTSYATLKKEHEGLKRKREPARDMALCVNNCIVNPPATTVQIRGSPHSKGKVVTPGFPAIYGQPDPVIPAPAKDAKTSGRRSVLAKWIASDTNHLTSRVIVNRIWQGHFGKGIVGSSNDFGKFGEKPTHPELLDWLANDFVKNGWKIKRLHKLIMLSSTYQLAASSSEKGMLKDPANQLLWRYSPRRLLAEEVRDSILAVNGTLNPAMGGPGIYPVIPKEVLAGQSVPGQGWGKSSESEAARRSIYVYQKRSLLVPILSNHDQADTDSSCPVRYATTVPTQALGMINSEFMNDQARLLATRIQTGTSSLEEAITQGIRLTTGRNPDAAEVKKDADFVRGLQKNFSGADSSSQALKNYCLLLLNTNEFIYLD